MICKNCGMENDGSSQFCESCGSRLTDLTNSYREDNSRYKGSSGKFLPLIIILLLVLIGIGAYVGYNLKKNKEIASLEKQLASEKIDKNYKNMLDINLSLYELTKDEGYKKEADKIQALADSQEQVEKAKAYTTNKEFAQAYKIILNLKNSSVKDQNQLDILTTDFQGSLTNFIKETNASKDFATSANVINDLLAIEADNEFFKGLLGTTESSKSNQEEEQAKQETQSSGKAYLNKTYYVSVSGANVRSGPNLSSSIWGKLDIGDSIYISNYAIDDRGVIWLECEYGWISQKNISKSKASKSKKIYNSADSYIGTYASVKTNNSNVRKGPGLDYAILDSLTAGTSVYIYDYDYDNRGVAWFLTDYGWISSKNL